MIKGLSSNIHDCKLISFPTNPSDETTLNNQVNQIIASGANSIAVIYTSIGMDAIKVAKIIKTKGLTENYPVVALDVSEQLLREQIDYKQLIGNYIISSFFTTIDNERTKSFLSTISQKISNEYIDEFFTLS